MATPDPEPTTASRRLQVAVMVGALLPQMDLALVVQSLPDMSTDLDAGRAAQVMVVLVYMLVLAVALVAGGRLGDRVGNLRVMRLGLVVFGAAGLLAGVAPGVGPVIAARALQGLGGALIGPNSRALLVASAPEGDRGPVMGRFVQLGAAALVSAPVIGGLLVDIVSWRGVFLLAVPVAAAALWAMAGVRPPDRTDTGETGRRAHPSHDRTFAVETTLLGAASLALAGTAFLIVQYLQVGLGLTATETGLAAMPVGLAAAATAPLAGRLADVEQPRRPASIGTLLLAVGLLVIGLGFGLERLWVIVGGMTVVGAGAGFTHILSSQITIGALRAEDRAAASGAVHTVQTVGSAIGVAAMSTLAAGLAHAGQLVGTAPEALAVTAVLAAGVLGAATLVAVIWLPGGRRPPTAGRG